MRSTIFASVIAILGIPTYYMPRSTHEFIYEEIEVPVVVKEYVMVPYEVPLIIQVPRYEVEEPIIVRPKFEEKAPVDWDRVMIEGVKYFEGYKSKKYYCCAGVATIGYGCTDKNIINKGSLSEATANNILLEEIKNALTSFTFNCGVTNLNNLITGENRLNSGNYKSVEKILPMYRKAGGKVREGLEKRRAWELSLWRGETNLSH